MPSGLSFFFKSNHSQILLMFGTLFAQVLSLISTFVIANRVQPSEFGKYAFTMTVLLVLMPITTRKFETVIVNVEQTSLTSVLIKAFIRIFYLSLITSAILSTLAYFYWNYSFTKVSIYFALVFNVNICINLAVLMISINLRERNFGAVAYSGLWQNGLTLLFQLALIKWLGDTNGLLFTYVAGRSLSLVTYFFWREIRQMFNFNLFQKSNYSSTKSLKERTDNIFYSSVFDQIAINSPIMIAYLANNHQLLGYVSMAFSLAMAPATTVTSAYSMSFLAQKKWEEGVASKSNKYVTPHNYTALGLLSIFYLVVMLMFADIFVNIMFGEEWEGVQDYIRIFSIPISLIVILTPILQHKIANSETELVKRVQMFSIASVLIISAIGYFIGGVEAAVKLALYAKVVGQLVPLVIAKRTQS